MIPPSAEDMTGSRGLGDSSLNAMPARGPTLSWVLAAAAALLLHGAVAAWAFALDARDDTDVAMGAPAIEIGVEIAAPHMETSDLPPGVLAEDSEAAEARLEQQKKEEEKTLPVEKPTDTDDPDRLVSEKPVTKPAEVLMPEAVQSKASAASIASQAAAPPASEKAKEAPRSTAPVQGTSDSDRRVVATWQRQLVAHLDRHKRYPRGTPSRNATIMVEFTIDRSGHLVDARVSKSSGDYAFDEAAIDMMHLSNPVPPPPAVIADESLTFSVPVVFKEKRN